MTDGPPSRVRRALIWVLPAAAVLVAAAFAAVAYRSDRNDGPGRTMNGSVSRSSTIALDAGGTHLWVTSPDDDEVVEVDAATLNPGRRLAVAGAPQELTRLGDRLLVAGSQTSDLTVLHVSSSATPVVEIALPCGGARGVVTVPRGTGGAPGDLAVVTCPTDGLIAVVDLDAGETVAVRPLAGRPTGVVRHGDLLTVSTAADGRLHTWRVEDLVGGLPAAPPADGEARAHLAVEPVSVRTVWVDADRSASSLAALDAGSLGTVAAYQVVDNQRRLSKSELEEGDATYGTPIDGRARLEPAISGPCGARFADVGDPAESLSGPVALAAAPLDDLVWVVGQFSHSVSVVRCDGAGHRGSRSPTVASYDVGDGARGIALDARGTTAYVDVGFDHVVARLDLATGLDDASANGSSASVSRTQPAKVGKRDISGSSLSPLAEEGRRMFTDATDQHLTPFGVVTCASCHPSAGDDGLSWRIETKDAETGTIERKVRRTPAAWEIDAQRKPLHWNGEFASTDALVLDTVQDLLGGDGLLVDTAAISAYLAETPAPPGAPEAGAAQTGSAARGQEVFESSSVGCSSCHLGEAGTDGQLHDVLAPSPMAAAQLGEVATPSLFGVRGRAPYGHDGRARDLEDLLDQHLGADGEPLALTPKQRRDVIAYLRSR